MISKLMNVRVPYEVFIARWKRLATCFVDTTENRSGLWITYQKGIIITELHMTPSSSLFLF
mgnify:CR=1 FL=1